MLLTSHVARVAAVRSPPGARIIRPFPRSRAPGVELPWSGTAGWLRLSPLHGAALVRLGALTRAAHMFPIDVRVFPRRLP
jgi:hypothetical protein